MIAPVTHEPVCLSILHDLGNKSLHSRSGMPSMDCSASHCQVTKSGRTNARPRSDVEQRRPLVWQEKKGTSISEKKRKETEGKLCSPESLPAACQVGKLVAAHRMFLTPAPQPKQLENEGSYQTSNVLFWWQN